MARTREFDRRAVVRAARQFFWEHGYEDASIAGLEAATGLNRSSIYNAFDSKRGLFDAAVQSYLDEVVRPRLAPLEAETVEAGALRAYLSGLADAFARVGSMPAAHGCLLINAAGAPVARDSDVAHVIDDYRAELRTAIGRGVDVAVPAASAARRARLADAVTGLVVAAFALVRPSAPEAIRSLETAAALVDAEGAAD
ncbi:MAG: TetR family transcriptional regulator [Microbacterium sp. 69-7]|uniref:TetR/AcrR family transcriptional regulator n=1 Tax=unclassified Microbacterium TaxID=2609290 RepID=UPI00045092B2|nr:MULTISPECIES: TetR/AcrR family transcriptional regulator [unclassified Microbacterium]EXJ52054.1 TetR family transcriptional regulator [Microbacterium sp. MRS-1]ODT24581.1 MAG: TetR family transcriptional regulator [Microbacterium sp. SCN 69-37]OJU43172.1 MAG: TetR family transcriptional regulator [Microbacterium sp. 69-7]